MFEVAIVSMLHGYSRQRRTIGSFAATAGLLVMILSVLLQTESKYGKGRNKNTITPRDAPDPIF